MNINDKVVQEVTYGVYVWRMPDGRWVGDDDGNFLSIAAMQGDKTRIRQLTDAVRSYGVDVGAPHFLAGHRKINDEEHARQRFRMSMGLLPDDYDIPALIDEQKFKRQHGR